MMQKISKRLLSFLLVLMMVSGIFTSIPQVDAAEITKTAKTYEIAVVFDNSGSMYMNAAWCRAKYAMEIFASMLNYNNGDKLKIFPMWEVTTDGSTPSKGGSYAPIEIESKDDIDKISNLYTVNPSNTPFAPITEAYNYLKTSQATEKWLIVLTDGAFNQDARNKGATIKLQERLQQLASKDIKVQYLGFGSATELKSNTAKYFYAKKSTDTSLKDDLVSICNSIFQRSVLPKESLNGSTLTLDISMKNLIVFAQGANAKINSLTDSSGKEVAVTLDSGQRTYSTIKAYSMEDAPVDKSLAGQVVTFDACPKGTYTLNYSGAESIQIFYEPDVDISVTLKNSDGQVVDISEDEITAGDYVLNYTIVDNVTGEDVLDSELLGNDVSLKATVIDSEGNETEISDGDKITLEPDSATYVKVVGTYLKDYTISTEDNKEGFTFEVVMPATNALSVNADVTQPANWYVIKKHDEWKPIKVTLAYNGQPLTDEQLAQVQWEMNTSEPLEFWYETLPGESACNIYIGHNQDGDFVEPESGAYRLQVKATVLDEYGREVVGEDIAKFEIQPYAAFWRWLIYLVVLAIIALIILYIMSRKAMPKDIEIDNADFTVMGSSIPNGVHCYYDRKGKSLKIDSVHVPAKMDAECHMTLQLQPFDRRWTPSKRRSVQIVGVTAPGMGIRSVDIDGVEFERRPGGWGVADDPTAPVCLKSRNANISIETTHSMLECSLRHN